MWTSEIHERQTAVEYLVDSEFEGAFLVLGAAEGAELAPVHTDIGRIYVAVDDEIGFLTVLSFGGFRCHPPDPKISCA